MLYVGVDWATEEHQISIADSDGKEVATRRVRNDGVDIAKFIDELMERCHGVAEELHVGIESTSTALVDALLERQIAVYALNPKQLDRFRDRHTVAGAKDDRRDAYVLADSLRTDRKLYRKLELADPLMLELKEVSRARDEIGEDIVALANRLTAHVRRYYPQILELGSFYEDKWLLEMFELAPAPASLKHLKRAKVEALLKRSHVHRWTTDKLLAKLREKPLPVAPGVAEAASAHARMVLRQLTVAFELRTSANRKLDELLAKVQQAPSEEDEGSASEGQEPKPKMHRDATILLSLPGAGRVVGATMLAEATSALAERDYQGLRSLSGVAPVTSQTGKQRQHSRRHPTLVMMRRACNRRLRDAMHAWAGVAIQHDPRLRALYREHRARGHQHARALRGVGDRLLKMLVAMLKTDTMYDATKRATAATVAA